MICPHCNQSIKYKERSNNTCSNCNKEFAFEPKTHPLLISDKYFSTVVEKLSYNGNLFYTSEQLHFAVSRKKIKSGSNIIGLIILAVITTFIALVISAVINPILMLFIPVGILLIWIIYIGKKIT